VVIGLVGRGIGGALGAVLAVACSAAAPEVRDEPLAPIVLALDVQDGEIGVVSRSGGMCNGEVAGVLTISDEGGETRRIEVRAPTMEERCPNCLGDGLCPCEHWPIGFMPLTRPGLPDVGYYSVSGRELSLSCAPERAELLDVSIVWDGLTLRRRTEGDPPTFARTTTVAVAPTPPAPEPPPVAAPSPQVAEQLDVVLRELGTDRPIAGVRVGIVEVRACERPRGGGRETCTPRAPRRLRATTDADGVARFRLPPPRVAAVSEPAGLHYVVSAFRARGFAGSYPLDEGMASPREARLETWEPLTGPAIGQRVIYRLVPRAALAVPDAGAARAASARHIELAAWIAQHGATAGAVTERGLLLLVQWAAGAEDRRCALVDAVEGGVQILGTADCP
jgi:hypothetical protein